jgi:hypothetical protein
VWAQVIEFAAACRREGPGVRQVIVVESAAIAEAKPRALRRLYVVRTRPVSRLTVLHTRDLPLPLVL